MHPISRTAFAIAALAPAALAQQAPPPSMRVDLPFDSGWTEGAATSPSVPISHVVNVDGALWLRLEFSEVELAGDVFAGNGATLRITSLLDAAVQELDAIEVEQWQRTSAYFNGDSVLVEVVAPPGAGASRIVLEAAVAGVDPAFPESQCGPTDDRQTLPDARTARLLPGGCTGFLTDECPHCLLTAGHCATSLSVAEFDVPMSTSSGALVHPPPQDQYAIDYSSRQWQSAGIGNDWCTFGCFPNSNTGLTPFQAQGSYYIVANPPSYGTSHTALILGYGTDSTPASHNQVLQFAAGPWLAYLGTELRYFVDTEGGNSGSPVCLDQTLNAFGIHTHGGCTTSGSGYNAGTAASHAGLRAALSNPIGICAAGISVVGGAPTVLRQGVTETVRIQVSGPVVAGSPTMYHRYGNSPFAAQPMASLGGGLYEGSIPPSSCGDVAQFYFAVQNVECGALTLPTGGASNPFDAQVGDETLVLDERFANTGGWSDETSGGGGGGGQTRWEHGTPIDDPACPLDPAGDADGNGRCWVTANASGCRDVDSNPLVLESPSIDVNSATPVSIRYEYFLGLSDASGADYLAVQVGTANNNNVSTYFEVERHVANTGLGWVQGEISQSDLDAAGIVVLDKIGLRFVAVDAGTDSTVEAGVDHVVVTTGTCGGVGANYCTSGALGSVISATGSASVAANDLVLHASDVPPAKSGIFFYGATQIAAPFGNGTRCVGSPAYRLPLVNSGAGTTLDFAVDYAAVPGAAPIDAGSTWNFQAWFRDGTGSFDLSDGLEITFVP